MNLKSTRKLLSVLFAFVIAMSLTVATVCAVASSTVTSKDFYIKHIVNDNLVNQCEGQLATKYETLSKKSNIPTDVFYSVTTAFNTAEAIRQASSYLFDENDETLHSDNKVDFFKDSIKEYLDANKLKYSDEAITNAAKEATDIYSDTVGLHNVGAIEHFVFDTRNIIVRTMSVSVIIAGLCIAVVFSIYREKEKAILYIGSGVLGAGIADIITSILLIITKVGGKYNVTPAVYVNTFSGMHKTICLYALVGGIVVVGVGILVFSMGVKQAKKKQSRADARFFKVIDKL